MRKLTRFEIVWGVLVLTILAVAITAVTFLVPFFVIFGVVTLATDFTFQTRLAIAGLGAGGLLGILESFSDYRDWRKRVTSRRSLDG